jgi:hypothetical protein
MFIFSLRRKAQAEANYINGTFGPYDPRQRIPPGVWAIVSTT